MGLAISTIRIALQRNSHLSSANLAAGAPLMLSEMPAIADSVLSFGERRAWNEFPTDRRRISFLSGRRLAKVAIAGLTQIEDLTKIEISYGVFGQPVVKGDARNCHIGVSISHCSKLAVALAHPVEQPMGIDIESCLGVQNADIAKQFNPAEIATLASFGLQSWECSAILWTAKEALSKVLKCGFTVPLSILSITTWERSTEGMYEGNFEHFTQYKACTWLEGGLVLSVVLPRKTQLSDLGGFLQTLTK